MNWLIPYKLFWSELGHLSGKYLDRWGPYNYIWQGGSWFGLFFLELVTELQRDELGWCDWQGALEWNPRESSRDVLLPTWWRTWDRTVKNGSIKTIKGFPYWFFGTLWLFLVRFVTYLWLCTNALRVHFNGRALKRLESGW